MRGVQSQGMLCSARELGLSDDHSGLLELPAGSAPGADVRELLELDDHVFTIKLTPNRADCLSILGVAREVAALTRSKMRAPDTTPVPSRSDARHPVRISAAEGCGRFTGRVIRGVDARARDARTGCASASSAPASDRFRRWSTSPTTSCSSSGGRCTSTTWTS